ncbi:MAG: hypothetical protein IPM39_20770 [Chloroflexi bacterium]|nr:hypothetical protein [Chloroflexota bacterium]
MMKEERTAVTNHNNTVTTLRPIRAVTQPVKPPSPIISRPDNKMLPYFSVTGRLPSE